jgi:hypothetical protein
MDKIEQDDSSGLKSSPEEKSTPAVPEQQVHFAWKELLSAVVATGILGALATGYFQQRTWNNQKAVDKIQIDANKAFELEQNLSDFMDERHAATQEVGEAIQSQARKEWESPLKQFKNESYARRGNNLEGQVAFFIDSPFKQQTDDKRREISKNIDCLSYALESASDNNIDTQSAKHLLQIVQNCYALAEGDIDAAASNKPASAGEPPHPSCPDRSGKSAEQASSEEPLLEWEKNMCNFKTRMNHIFWLNHVLRCTIFEKAVSIRDHVVESSWYFMPQIPSIYHLRRGADDCIRDYRQNDYFGLAANPRKK